MEREPLPPKKNSHIALVVENSASFFWLLPTAATSSSCRGRTNPTDENGNEKKYLNGSLQAYRPWNVRKNRMILANEHST